MREDQDPMSPENMPGDTPELRAQYGRPSSDAPQATPDFGTWSQIANTPAEETDAPPTREPQHESSNNPSDPQDLDFLAELVQGKSRADLDNLVNETWWRNNAADIRRLAAMRDQSGARMYDINPDALGVGDERQYPRIDEPEIHSSQRVPAANREPEPQPAPTTQENRAPRPEPEAAQPPVEADTPDEGLTYYGAQHELSILEAIKRERALTPLERDQESQLNRRIISLEAQAQQLPIYKAAQNELRGLESRLANYMALSDKEREKLIQDIDRWGAKTPSSIRGQGSSRETLLGAVEAVSADERKRLQERVEALNLSPEIFMRQVNNDTRSVNERLQGVENLANVELQRQAMRVILDKIEFDNVGRYDNTYQNITRDLLNKAEKCDPSVAAEVRARVHLQSCASALRRVVIADPEKVSFDFENVYKQQIGDHALDGKDFDLLLKQGLPGLDVQGAFQVLQAGAYNGAFSGQSDISQNEALKAEFVAKIQGEYHLTEYHAQKSYDLALRIAEATFERSVWDTSGSDYVSQAIYFGEYTASRSDKGPDISRGHIKTLGTSFFRSLVYKADKARVFNQAIANNRPGDKLENRYRIMRLNRIQTVQSDNHYLSQLPANSAARAEVQRIAASRVQALAADQVIDGLSFNTADFQKTDPDAYATYLTKTLPRMLEAKKELLNKKIDIKTLNEQKYKSMEALFEDIDPEDTMNLSWWWFVGTLQNYIWENDGEWTECDRKIKLARVEKYRRVKKDKSVVDKTIIPMKLPDGTDTLKWIEQHMAADIAQGHQNESSHRREGIFRIRK